APTRCSPLSLHDALPISLRYAELGLGELVKLPPDDGRHVYHLFVVRTPERDRVRAALDEAGIGCASYYVTPLHLQPALAYLGHRSEEHTSELQSLRHLVC